MWPWQHLSPSTCVPVCYVSWLISTDFSVDVFISLRLPWKSNLCFLSANHQSQNTHLFRFQRDYSEVSTVLKTVGGWSKAWGQRAERFEKKKKRKDNRRHLESCLHCLWQSQSCSPAFCIKRIHTSKALSETVKAFKGWLLWCGWVVVGPGWAVCCGVN